MSAKEQEQAMEVTTEEQDEFWSAKEQEQAIEVTTEELDEFYRNLVDHSQFKSLRVFDGGSRAEIEHQSDIFPRFGLLRKTVDSDVMRYRIDWYVFPHGKVVPEMYNGHVVRMNTHDIHPGYVRLIKGEDKTITYVTELRLEDMYTFENESDKPRNRPAIEINKEAEFQADLKKYGGSPVNADGMKAIPSETAPKVNDKVYAVHSPYWPVEACEWITRSRKYGSPSKSIIKQVVRYGCDFVNVLPKFSGIGQQHNPTSADMVWRFSFSKAELIIVRRWTSSQRTAYRTLHLLNKTISHQLQQLGDKSKLCSYYFKTLMLWATEEKPPEFWSEDCLINSIHELLKQMIQWVRKRYCPNYFIPSNNMMDHLTDMDLHTDVHLLTSRAEENIEILSTQCGFIERSAYLTVQHTVLPMWVFSTIVIILRAFNLHDNFKNIFEKRFSDDVHAALSDVLDGIYMALEFHKRSIACMSQSREVLYRTKAQGQFEIACRCENATRQRDNKLKILPGLVDMFTSMFIQNKAHDPVQAVISSGELLDKADMSPEELLVAIDNHNKLSTEKYAAQMRNTKYEVEEHGDVSLRNIPYSPQPISITVHRTYKFGEKIQTRIEDYKDCNGISPTVNIAWFISKAYLANFYYTTKRNYSEVIDQCNDIITASVQSRGNGMLACGTFVLALSTQWANIFDNQVIERLGFYCLCQFLFGKICRSRSLYLGVCPVQFAVYLKSRSAVRDNQPEEVIQQYLNKFVDHCKVCRCEAHVNTGFYVLRGVLMQENR